GVITAGWGANVSATVVEAFASAAGWPVLADAVSNLRTGAHAVSTYDLLLRSPEIEADLRPDLALRLGAPLTGKPANRFLAGVPALLVDPDRRWLDPARTAHELVAADAEPLLAGLTERLTPVADPPACRRWMGSEARVRARVDALLD
ncbi:MAG: hypothetical protein ACXW2C_10740, partial [Acidimicrobiia bacterium]